MGDQGDGIRPPLRGERRAGDAHLEADELHPVADESPVDRGLGAEQPDFGQPGDDLVDPRAHHSVAAAELARLRARFPTEAARGIRGRRERHGHQHERMPTDGRHGGGAHGDQHASCDDADDLPQHPMRVTGVIVDGGEQVTGPGRVQDVRLQPQHHVVNPEPRPIPEVPLQGHLRQPLQQEEHLVGGEEQEKPRGDRPEQLHLAVQDHLIDDQPEDVRVGAAQEGGCHHRHEQVHEGEQRRPHPSPDAADSPETALARSQLGHQSLRVRSAWSTEVVPTVTSISVAVPALGSFPLSVSIEARILADQLVPSRAPSVTDASMIPPSCRQTALVPTATGAETLATISTVPSDSTRVIRAAAVSNSVSSALVARVYSPYEAPTVTASARSGVRMPMNRPNVRRTPTRRGSM